MKTKYLNLALVFCVVMGSLLTAHPAKAQTTSVDIWHNPGEPSIYDGVYFGVFEWEEGMICHWNFGDGSTSDVCYVDGFKKFKADGDYTVSVDVVFADGRTASAIEIVPVRTHDVAITKFIVPQSARAGQTRQITVYVRNTRYPEQIQVELCKNDCVYPPIGTLIQDVPPRSANRTTAFSFSYTFTAEDARIGKITFRAQAFIIGDNGPDDWPVDNDVTAFPTRVSR
jgi:hypothetical protein